MPFRICLFLCFVISFPSISWAEDNSDPESLYPDHTLLEQLKNRYRDCMKKKAADLLLVSDFATAIKFAPIACRRDYFEIRMLFFGRAFKPDMSQELLASVESGIEIDMINYLLEVALKRKRGK